MSLSAIALKQREKEAEALKSFLIYSLIGSLALHIGVLTVNLGKFLTRVPKLKDEPIEITVIDASVELPVPPKADSGGGGGGGGGGGKITASAVSSYAPIGTQSSKLGITQKLPETLIYGTAKTPSTPRNKSLREFLRQSYKQEISSPIRIAKDQSVKQPLVETTPEVVKPVETIKTPVKEQATPEVVKPVETIKTPPKEQAKQPTQESNTSIQKLFDRLKTPNSRNSGAITANSNGIEGTAVKGVPNSYGNGLGNGSSTGINSGGGTGNGVGNGSGNGVGNGSGNGVGNGSGNGVGNGSGNGVGNGSGNGVGNGSGNGVGNGSGNKPKPEEPKKVVATEPTPPKPTPEKSSRLNPADCDRCNIKYPERARKRKIEGNPEVAIDHDENGKVTNVRLTRSSGNQELDDALLEQARDFKLKPSSGSRQGVRVRANFAIEGSQRHQEAQERQRKREEQQRKRSPDITDVPPETTIRKRVETDTPKQPEERPRKRVETDTPKQPEERLRKRVETDTPKQPEERLRKRVETEEAPKTPVESDTEKTSEERRQRKLIEGLRRRIQASESPPQAPVQPDIP
jgi:TonB family protein